MTMFLYEATQLSQQIIYNQPENIKCNENFLYIYSIF